METENTLPVTESTPPEDTSPGEGPAEKETVGRRKSASRRRIMIAIVVSLINVGLLTLLWSQLLTPAQNQTNSGSSGNDQSSPLIGHPAPDFTLPVLSTRPAPAIHLAGLRGKPVMLNFWASWCDVCKREAPLLESTWQRVQGQGIVFLGIDIQDTQSEALSFLQTYGITYPNVVDVNGSVTINYGVTGVPETFFIDRRGVVVYKVIGELTEQTLQRNLQSLS